MKRIVLIVSMVILLSACVTSKDYSATDYLINAEGYIEIIPGYGLRDVHLGLSESEALKILGAPQDKKSLEEEKAGYWYIKNYSSREFDTGFDYVYSWFENKEHPIFKVFIKDKKVCAMRFADANFSSSRAKLYRVQGTALTFGSDEDVIERELGQRESYFAATGSVDGGKHSVKVSNEWEYPSKGLTVISLQGEIQALDVYLPIQ